MNRRATALILIALSTLPLAARVRSVRSGNGDTPGNWLRERAITDAQFVELTRTARVVALGDATHGTHETYAAKQRLIPLLVANGFRTLTFEAPYAEWTKLDEYVAHGTGDLASALEFRRYWFWDTNEIASILEWARGQNAAGLTPPIRITGVDSTEPVSAAKLVVERLRGIDAGKANQVEQSYACLAEIQHGMTWCRFNIEGVLPSLQAYGDEELLRLARIVEQGEEAIATRHESRDEAMAENVLWHVNRGEKVIALGHNEHWGQTSYILNAPIRESAGTYLSEALGDDYFVLGSVLLDGTFLAIDYDGSQGEIRPQIMTTPSADDFGTLFDQAGYETMIVPLSGALPHWLAGTHRTRIAGSSVQSRTRTTRDVEADFGKKFDAVLYVRRSTPTQLRHWPVF